MSDTKEKLFKQKSITYHKQAEKLASLFNRISIIRISVFIVYLIILIYLANEREATGIAILTVIFLGAFGWIVKYHNRIRYSRNHCRFLEEINLNEIERRNGRLASFDKGADFIDEDHAYSSDLDIFGNSSLFQLVNRTVTVPGRELLAERILSPLTIDEISENQESAQELESDVEWMQQFEATGMHHKNESFNEERFNEWMQQGTVFTKSAHNFIRFFLPGLFILIFTLILFDQVPFQLLYLIFAINGVYIWRIFNRVKETSEYASDSLDTLKAYRSLLQILEKKEFKSSRLQSLKGAIETKGRSASNIVNSLVSFSEKLDSRSNIFYWILNIIFLLDMHWMVQLDLWKKKYAGTSSHWFDTVNEFEVLVSLASTANTSDLSWPKVSASKYHVRFEKVGHPLIPVNERVDNDFSSSGKGTCLIITGSNMSGKSTFLRTVGINLVLAYAGGPVCAQMADISIFSVFSGMRVKDNLSEHVSSFYAELKRIRQLLDLVDSSEIPVFYMLDEILKGTNSADRHKGSESLIMQLIQKECMGLISTHDIELGVLADKDQRIENYNFSSIIRDNEIIFDYLIRAGICESFNASKLMEKMGIITKN